MSFVGTSLTDATSIIQIPAFINPFIEDENTVRNRILAAFPDGLSQETGTWARDFGEIAVAEFVRQWSSIGFMLAQVYVGWATGQQLDAWATSYGLQRGAGNAAWGEVRFYGPGPTPENPQGTAVPPGSVLEVPQTDPDADRIRFATSNAVSMYCTAAGYIDVPIVALEIGVEFNVAPGAITLLDAALPAITQINNLLPTVGGEDVEVDDDLRQRVLQQARLPTGAGTALDYQVWGGEVPGVGDTAVYTQWDTSGLVPGLLDGRQNGSVMMVLRDPFNLPADFSIVQTCQRHVAPSRQAISMFEQGEWSLADTVGATLDFDTIDQNTQVGSGSARVTFSGSGSTATIEIAQTVDLSRFSAYDTVQLWVKCNDWSKLTSLHLRFLQDDADYYDIPFTLIASDGVSIGHPNGGADWWMWRTQFGQYTATGNPNWAGINTVQLLAAGGSGLVCNFDYLIARFIEGSTGVGGRAPVGADVTCIAPVPLPINVNVSNSLLDDGYTLVDAPGQTNATTLLRLGLDDFFAGLKPGRNVRLVDIAKVIHDTPGFLDFTLALPQATGTPPAVPVAITQDPTLGTLTTA